MNSLFLLVNVLTVGNFALINKPELSCYARLSRRQLRVIYLFLPLLHPCGIGLRPVDPYRPHETHAREKSANFQPHAMVGKSVAFPSNPAQTSQISRCNFCRRRQECESDREMTLNRSHNRQYNLLIKSPLSARFNIIICVQYINVLLFLLTYNNIINITYKGRK